MHATDVDRSSAETVAWITATLTGLGAVTMALFPLALPFVILLGVATVPLLVLPVVAVVAVALVTAIWLGVRAIARAPGRLLRRARPTEAELSHRGRSGRAHAGALDRPAGRFRRSSPARR